MATTKRYYWIKLKESFMTSDEVDFLMGQPDGANYVVLYQLLCLKTINTGGKLERQIGEVIIPYDESKIQRDTKYFSIDTVRVALELYKALDLIYADENGTLCLSNYSEIVGSETNWAIQKRGQRAGLPPTEGGHCPPNVRQMSSDCQPNVRTDIDIEKEIDIENNTPPLSPPGEKETVSFDIPFDGKLKDVLTDWLVYKKEKHQTYKPRGWAILMTQVRKYVDQYGESETINAINNSMASNYMGIVFDRIGKQERYQTASAQQRTYGQYRGGDFFSDD